MLAQGIVKDSLIVFDTQGTAAGAAAAAKQAMRKRPSILIGPLLSNEVRPVIAVAGGNIPVVAFSNDAALLDSGAFLLGITAEQSVSAILGYARARGIRRVGVFTAAKGWRAQMLAAARKTATAIGIDVVVLPDGTPLKPESLAVAAGGEAPDALLLSTGDPLLAASRDLQGSGIQLLGAFDGLTYSPAAVESPRRRLAIPRPIRQSSAISATISKRATAPRRGSSQGCPMTPRRSSRRSAPPAESIGRACYEPTASRASAARSAFATTARRCAISRS